MKIANRIGGGLKICTLSIALCISGCANGQDADGQMDVYHEESGQGGANSVHVSAKPRRPLKLDSLRVEKTVSRFSGGSEQKKQIREFYASRDYRYAWLSQEGLNQSGSMLWNQHNRYLAYSGDSTVFDRQLHEQVQAMEDEERLSADADALELRLTAHFMKFIRNAYAGKLDPGDLRWRIPRKKISAVALLDEVASSDTRPADGWEPVNDAYKRARRGLQELYQVKKQGGWPEVPSGVYRRGESSPAIDLLRKRLAMGGYFSGNTTSTTYDAELEQAVKLAQVSMGLTADGVAGPNTTKALNVSVDDRIRQLLVNMERMRWMPVEREGRHLEANIPEYKLHVYGDDGKEAFNMNIVVGKAAHRTVIFSDELKYVVFSPYWNIPASIVRNEILPAMKRNPGYLASKNMERTGTRGGLPVIRQKPGGSNALGRVKFIFPNNYNIYFHDSPAESLFERTRRAFSHGCVRLAEPERLARFLLKDEQKWTDEAIHDAMYSGKEKWVPLDETVPVTITYFTAWADADGRLNFRPDIYGHDKEMTAALFQD